MSEQPKPCPLCGPDDVQRYNSFVKCEYCGLTAPDATWQALPRPSDAVMEVAREIQAWANRFLRGLPIQSDALGFAARLKATAGADMRKRVGASAELAPAKVWVRWPSGAHKGNLHVVTTIEETVQLGDPPGYCWVRVPVHGAPTAQDEYSAPGFPLACSFCGGSSSFVVVGPRVCICVDCAQTAAKGKGCGIPDAAQDAETVRAACQRRQSLNGADAQALEHALTITERERDAIQDAGKCIRCGYSGPAKGYICGHCEALLTQDCDECDKPEQWEALHARIGELDKIWSNEIEVGKKLKAERNALQRTCKRLKKLIQHHGDRNASASRGGVAWAREAERLRTGIEESLKAWFLGGVEECDHTRGLRALLGEP